MLRFIKLLFQLIMSPARGWEDISAEGIDPSRLARTVFFPLTVMMGLAVFLQGVYHLEHTFVKLLDLAVIEFVAFFVSYFIATHFMSTYIYRFTDSIPSEKRNHTYVLMGQSLLALSLLVQNCLPFDIDLVLFLGIYTAIVLWRGDRYMAVREESVGRFMIFTILTVIVPPFLIIFIFNLIL